MPIIKSDQDLIKSYLSGNETAFEILIAKHKDKVFSFIPVSYTHLRAHET